MTDILVGKRPWSALFEPAFFFTYNHYIVVIVRGEEKRAFVERCGLVESRLRVLVRKAEENCHVKLAHVNCRAYGRGPIDGESVAHVKKWFIGIEFESNTSATITTTTKTTTVDTKTPFSFKENFDLSGIISSFEYAIGRSPSTNDTNTKVLINYAKK